jgi:predicted RNA-binding protein with RPS1 domain
MSDEMVQEKTSPVVAMERGNGHEEGQSSANAMPVSSTAAAGAAATDEPAPAQPAAVEPTAPVLAAAEPAVTPVSVAADTSVPPAAAPAPNAMDDDTAAFEKEMQALDNMGKQYDRSLQQLRENEVITGTVMRVDRREGVLVDVGAKSEGIIRPNELSRDSNINPEDVVKVGDKIKVYVLEPENQDGIPILSKKRADFEQAWDKVQQAKETQEVLQAMVTDRVKGGLVVDLGIRGFVPASHVGNGSLKTNLDKYVGQSISLKVIEVDKDRRKVVLSNKAAVEEERQARSQETKASLTPGQIRHGVVRRLTNYGAFIDLGGIDGLLHISEMSWTRINDPKEVLREGQELDVIVLKMDLENNRVSLGLRQILPDPWAVIGERYKEGETITGTVTRRVPFGAFVQVEGDVEGIIPNSEIPRNRGGKPGGDVVQGEQVEVKIIGLRPEERKMTLSLKALLPPEEREAPVPREPREPRAPGAANEAAPAREPAAGTAPKRGRTGRDGDEREDPRAFTGTGRQEEPRFNQFSEAFATARRSKRERRATEEEEEFDPNSVTLEDEESE